MAEKLDKNTLKEYKTLVSAEEWNSRNQKSLGPHVLSALEDIVRTMGRHGDLNSTTEFVRLEKNGAKTRVYYPNHLKTALKLLQEMSVAREAVRAVGQKSEANIRLAKSITLKDYLLERKIEISKRHRADLRMVLESASDLLKYPEKHRIEFDLKKKTARKVATFPEYFLEYVFFGGLPETNKKEKKKK